MKNILLLWMLVLSLNCFGQIEKLIPAKPSPIKLVNDYAATLSESEAESLENKLLAFRAATTNEIAVIILPTINEYAIEDVALGIFRKWGIGVKGENNGAILLVIKNDHKLRIQTGYGLESLLPDVECSHVIRNKIKPAFKNGQFYKGLDEGTTAMISAIDPAFADSLNNNDKINITNSNSIVDSTTSQDTSNQSEVYNQSYQSTKEDNNVGGYIGFGIVALFFIFIAIFGKKSNSTSSYGSGSLSDDFSSGSSSSSDSDSGGGDFGGGDSGGGGSSDSW